MRLHIGLQKVFFNEQVPILFEELLQLVFDQEARVVCEAVLFVKLVVLFRIQGPGGGAVIDFAVQLWYFFIRFS